MAANTRLPAGFEDLERFALHNLPDDAACLLRLLLSMTQAAMAVELHGTPRVPRSPFPHSINIAAERAARRGHRAIPM